MQTKSRPLAGTCERLDCVHFPLFHHVRLGVFDDGHRLPAVDLVRRDAVPIQVADGLHGVHRAVNFHLVRLNRFLDGSPNLRETRVHARQTQADVRGVLRAFDRRIIAGVERNRKSRIDDAPFYLFLYFFVDMKARHRKSVCTTFVS